MLVFCQSDLMKECMEELICKKRGDELGTRKKFVALHILVHSQKRFVKRPLIEMRYAERVGDYDG